MTRRSLVARLLLSDTPAASCFSYIKLALTKLTKVLSNGHRRLRVTKENVAIDISPTWRTLLGSSTCFTYNRKLPIRLISFHVEPEASESPMTSILMI